MSENVTKYPPWYQSTQYRYTNANKRPWWVGMWLNILLGTNQPNTNILMLIKDLGEWECD